MYRGCPAGTHTCAPDAQAVWHRSHSANSCVRRVASVVSSSGLVEARDVSKYECFNIYRMVQNYIHKCGFEL